MPKQSKTKTKDWELRPGSSQFTKGWILPTGELAQFGGTFHDDWLNGQDALRKKYGIPKSVKNQDESRIPAIKAGFGRVNYDKYAGRLTVEAREKNWPEMIPSVRELVQNNLDKIDRMEVHLLDNSGKKLSDSSAAQFYDIPREERVQNIPFTGGKEELAAQTGMAGEEGANQVFQKAAGNAFGKGEPTDFEKNLRAMGWSEERINEALSKRVNFQPGGSPRAIRAAAVKDIDTGKLFEGPLHFYAHQKMVEAGYDPHDLFRHLQGFTTNEGEFLSRLQAFERAKEMGQLKSDSGPPAAISENLKMSAQAPKPEEFQNEDTIGTALAKPGWAILTGTREAEGPATNEVNAANNARLESELKAAGYEPVPVSGEYKGVDQGRSFLVRGMTPSEAQDWGNRFGQESVTVPQGLLYGDGGMHLTDATQTIVGPDAKKQDGWSQVGNGPAFSLGIDFSKKVYPKPEEMVLSGIGAPKALSSKEVGDMTKAELAQHYPEAVIPKKKDEEIPSNIVASPLAKEAGGREKAVKRFADKLVDFARSVEKSSGYRAGLKWYSDFTPKLKKVFKSDAPVMAELLAATSPNNNPTTNFAFAYDALQGLKSGRFDKLLKKFHEGLAKIENDSWQPWFEKEIKAGNVKNAPQNPTPASFLAHWIDKFDLYPRQSNGALYSMHSAAVLKVFARKWLGQTSGPKTQNFVKNLLGTGHEATIDVWADRTMRRLGYADHQARWRILPKNVKGVSDEDFAFSQEAFREAAKQLGVKPDALQGGLWFAEKQLWADNGWGRLDLGDYRKEMAKVEMLEQGIQQRLKKTAAEAKAPKMEQPDLLVSPRESKL